MQINIHIRFFHNDLVVPGQINFISYFPVPRSEPGVCELLL